MEAASKGAKASGGGHGLKVRLVPKYVVDKQVRDRTPEQRRRMAEMEYQRLADERAAEADIAPRKASALGGAGRRPPPIEGGKGSRGMAEKPPEQAPDDTQ